MKHRSPLTLAALVLVLALLTACGASAASLRETREVSFQDAELTVSLGTNKSTGYEWGFSIDGDCIQQSVNKVFTLKPVDGQSTGVVHIGFQGLSEGDAVITFTTPNGWDGAGGGDTYTVAVSVNADGTIADAHAA